MINIKFPDGNVRKFDAPISGFKIAENISKSLVKIALAIKVNGVLRDLDCEIIEDAAVCIVTENDPESLEIIRHDAAHVLAEAVKALYPETQITIGPIIENGFFYDFYREKPFTQDDLPRIEAKMLEIIRRGEQFERQNIPYQDAIDLFTKQGELYKVEIIKDLKDQNEISIYHQGHFYDLCRGPHAPSTKHVKAFKLLKLAGAYWRGDSKNVMLQRIYGTAWRTQKELDEYLHMLEEAEKRDHRKLGQEMNLFHFQEQAPGVAFWHPQGWTLFQSLIHYMRKQQRAAGYCEISTPEIMDKNLWEISGHWEKFRENMFFAQVSDEERIYAVKPMNCPGCIQIFKHGIVSYKDFPIKLSEFGKVYRFEPSGALHGLMRVRGFTQDDAHIFCTEEELLNQTEEICKFMLKIYADCGFTDVRIKFADRPTKRIGDDSVWDKAESALLDGLKKLNLDYTTNPGEGAFYGPKLEFVLRDTIGRDWQIGTLQIDLNMPMRFNATYIAEDGKKHSPVMLHQATFGSLERFIGILLEHYNGWLPLWLAPTQVVILTINDNVKGYAEELQQKLYTLGARSKLDTDNETLNYKIRKHILTKVPIIAIIGEKEARNNTVVMRKIGQEEQEILSLDEFVKTIFCQIKIPK